MYLSRQDGQVNGIQQSRVGSSFSFYTDRLSISYQKLFRPWPPVFRALSSRRLVVIAPMRALKERACLAWTSPYRKTRASKRKVTVSFLFIFSMLLSLKAVEKAHLHNHKVAYVPSDGHHACCTPSSQQWINVPKQYCVIKTKHLDQSFTIVAILVTRLLDLLIDCLPFKYIRIVLPLLQ